MFEHEDNIVTLPFVAARRAASAPALARFGELLGASARMQEVYERIARVAPTSATVFLTGESGSGKEVVARTIHENSARASLPFLAVNCGAIPANLIEAELFGYEKGAFTGAVRMHRGFFERADGGTLLLDEITEMAPDMQARLLRVLETGRYARVGGEQELRARARIIAATNRDLRACGARRAACARTSCTASPSSRSRCRPCASATAIAELLAEHFLPPAERHRGRAEDVLAAGDRAHPLASLAGQRPRAQERRAACVHPVRRHRRDSTSTDSRARSPRAAR